MMMCWNVASGLKERNIIGRLRTKCLAIFLSR